MNNIKGKRKGRFDKSKNTKSDELYDSKDPSVDISSEEIPEIPKNETIEITEKPNRKTKRRRDLLVKEYDYQKMAVEYSLENVSQQLHNYRCAMEFLAHVNLTDNDTIVDRFKEIIYNYPNVDMSTFANKENAKLYLEKNPNVADEIEKAVREKAAAITKELEGNPSPKEKISKDEEK